MKCPKCGSENVSIQLQQVEGKTTKKRNGCLYGFCRFCLILCTCGLWLLVGKHDGSEKTKYKSKRIGICQNCGCQFDVK